MLFSQRKGLTPLKSLIQVDSVDSDLRNALWSAITQWHSEETQGNNITVEKLMTAFWLNFFKQPLDTKPQAMIQRIRASFFEGEWYNCYDILEFLVGNYYYSHRTLPLVAACNGALQTELSGYRIVGQQITPITSEAELSSIGEALANTDALRPVNEHLTTALNYLSDRQTPDYRNSIKESISAVESLCNLITGGRDTLANALKKIETKVAIHSALKKGFGCIYGYTSDASGIRHALLDEPNIDFDDAKFMLVSCSTFINYLIVKAAKAGVTF
jgi:hypothetical protein